MAQNMESFVKMSEQELSDFVAERRRFLQSARFGAAVRDVKSIREAKRDIARALTARHNRTSN